jgi:hypothetical protein
MAEPEPLALLFSEDVRTFLIPITQDACTSLGYRESMTEYRKKEDLVKRILSIEYFV